MPDTYYMIAVSILREEDRPMSAKEIVDEALRRRLLLPTGKTPLNTMAATLFRHTSKGDPLIRRVRNPRHSRNYQYVARKVES
ncbi:MAG: winged helix-turn-helix domain-containing protein [Patescibacteria group bacterium]|nr:winged helix-turn-helix domain-containing protein [Patescibacteria group bacterium]